MDETSSINELIGMARRGDQSARDELLGRYRPYLRILAAHKMGVGLKKRVDASDIVQETCLHACRGLMRFQGATEPEFSAWIKRILARRIADAARAKSIEIKPVEMGSDSAEIAWCDPADCGSTPSKKLMRGEAALHLAALLESLPEDQRLVVELRHVEGWSLKQIAEFLERSYEAAAGLYKRGLQNLRKRMSDSSSVG